MDIPERIKELREVLELSALDLARETGIPYETYIQYERGDCDIPISVLYSIAARLGVDPTVLLSGEDPKMDTVSVCRSGMGIHIERFPGYEFSSLAYNFKHRTMEPLLVTLDPNKEPAAPVTHSGQEFNYIIEGTVTILVGQRTYTLSAGDSLYFDATVPHAQYAIGKIARFITIIQNI
ncbi:MAG: XRE family transcriptional regulator [Treponema sp.]|jgi:transcriptional regulator with XRE-family HTH domain|nr:XRE family transcriptional regulator [Treponema sp.]